MVLYSDRVCEDASCLVETPEPTGASLAWQPHSDRRPQAARTGNPWEDDEPDESMGGNDPPLENGLPEGEGGAAAAPGGGDKAG